MVFMTFMSSVVSMSTNRVTRFLQYLRFIFHLTSPSRGRAVVRFFNVRVLFTSSTFRRYFNFTLITSHRKTHVTRLFTLSSRSPCTRKIRDKCPRIIPSHSSRTSGPLFRFFYHFIHGNSNWSIPEICQFFFRWVDRTINRRAYFTTTYPHRSRW